MDTLQGLAKKLQNKEISSTELAQESFTAVEKYNQTLNALVTVTKEKGLTDARSIDEQIAKSESLSPTAGIPVVVKDNLCVKDVRLTSSSKMLDDYITPYSATVVERIAGSVLIGKGNLDAFGFGASTENSGYGPTRNPWNKAKVSGGSSGGPAAAVASGMAAFALGTDTGSSIRQPAAMCGIVGLKPTYGRSSRYGLTAMGSSLDCPGPLTRCVEDAAYILQCIAGKDPHDATTTHVPVADYMHMKSVKGMKIGLPKEFMSETYIEALEKGVKENVLKTIDLLATLGAEIIEVSMPYSVHSLAVYYVITPSELSANMARYDGIRFGHTPLNPKDIEDLYFTARDIFEDEVKRRIFVGNYALSSGYYDAYYNKAMSVRRLIVEEVQKTFEQVDAIVCPTSPTVAFDIGQKADDPVAMYLADIYTVTANIAGIPGISIPCGLSDNLPVGFQIMGKQFDEQTVLSVAYALEQELQFAKHYQPDLSRL